MLTQYAFKSLAAAATTQVVTGPGRLVRIIFNTPIASSTVKLIDNTSGSTANMGTITNTTDVKPYALQLDIPFSTGLRVIASGNDDFTLIYDR